MTASDKADQPTSSGHGSASSFASRVLKRLMVGIKPQGIGMADLRPLILGMLLGGLGSGWWLSERVKQQEAAQWLTEQQEAEPNTWPPREFHFSCGWSYVKVDESGWSAGLVGSFQDLDNRLGRPSGLEKEVIIPIFPTVYPPQMIDKLYYDAILESGIKQGDKVLVIGTGSGADAWVASLKSRAPVYVLEVNPMAIANARATARLVNFQIKPLCGDIRDVVLPDDFNGFDFVLWNMPFVCELGRIEDNNFHDGDDGSILKRFLALLPSLLKANGQAIVLNSPAAKEMITASGVTTKPAENCMLFLIPNTAP